MKIMKLGDLHLSLLNNPLQTHSQNWHFQKVSRIKYDISKKYHVSSIQKEWN